MGRSNFKGEGGTIVKYSDIAVICAKTAEPIEMPKGRPKEACIRWGPDPMRRSMIRGKDMPEHARRQPTVSCAKMAEPTDLPFGLWTRVPGGSNEA